LIDRDNNRTRYMGRIGLDLFLRVAIVLGEIFEGDLISGLTFYAIAHANVKHLNRPRVLNPLAEGGLFPDELRKPVSCYSVAKELGLPRETIRRHALKLVARGLCVQTAERRYYVPSLALGAPQFSRLSRILEVELDDAMRDLSQSASNSELARPV
jgi:biotin operon repressor